MAQIRTLVAKQRAFSLNAFGKHTVTTGVHAHLLKEIDEVRNDSSDLTEWADCFILIMDGAHRSCDSSHVAAIHLTEQVRHAASRKNAQTLDELEALVQEASEGDLKNPHTWAVFARNLLSVARRVENIHPMRLYDAVNEKISVNMDREWGDVSKQDPSKPIEHKRTGEEQARKVAEGIGEALSRTKQKELAPVPEENTDPKPEPKPKPKKTPAKPRAKKKAPVKK
ncbi:coil containing protein [Vibrio phage 1.215.B._10N.222.54.F7]|nr:coil containing protein [Vibrio phage 1.215.A._10N.222.54.F7]AUR96053.1 coil containing protein [Vibrio phage 1.215.B._10N.222.54.F7]